MKKSCFILVLFICCQMILWSDPAQGATATPPEVVTLERPVQRIACLYAFTGHVVTMLGRGQDMVAVVKGLKKDKLLYQIVPAIQHLPVPFSGGIIHIEGLLNTRPDIVFLKPETAKIHQEIQKLEQFNLPYLVAGYSSMAEQMHTIEMIGRAIDREDKALAYNRYYREKIDLVRSRTRSLAEDKRVRLYHSINEPYRTDAPGTLEADWTQACGVVNVSVSSSLSGHDNKKFAGIEQILLWNPGVIIANEAGMDQLILTDKKWAPVQAVQENRVFTIPVGISRWGHPGGLETPLAILWTAKTVYPNLFPDMDMKIEIKQFYHQFFNLTLEDKMVDKILKGKGMRQEP